MKPGGHLQAVDLIGERFGQLVVLERAPNTRTGQTRWRTACDCGRVTITTGRSLRTRPGITCGRHPRGQGRKPVHGHAGPPPTPTYKAWDRMRRRGPVDDRWQTFAVFLADLGPKPEGSELRRLDASRGYGPGNVAWTARRPW